MSHDEIVFDEVKYREPERRCRPDRDRRWACLAYETPAPIDLPIYLDRETADLIERHALRDTSVELGGILLGKECVDESTGLPFVMVTRSLEAKHYENTQASFTYTHDSWEEISARDRLHPDLDIVGWYHTHPDFGIFLSSHDEFIHRHFFAQPLQVAYVVDPVRQTRGFFQWRDGQLEQVGGYFLFADRADRIALVRLVNDLENVPNAEGGGGGLSPRLEAQLIAMLTRPVNHRATATDQTQTAMLFSLIGSLAGMLVVTAAFFFFQMYREVAAQADSIKSLREGTDEILSAQRLALDSLLAEAGDGQPDKFTERYHRMARERDQLQKDLQRSKAVGDAVVDRATRLESEHAKLLKELDLANQVVEQYKEEKKGAPSLRSRLAFVEDELKTKARTIREKDRVLETIKDAKQAELLLGKYDRAWYAAVAGWGLFLVATLGLFTMFGQPKSSTVPRTDEHVDDPRPIESREVLRTLQLDFHPRPAPLTLLLALLLLPAAMGAHPHSQASSAAEPSAFVVEDLSPVPVPQPSALAVRYHQSGHWLWALGELWALLVPVVLLFSGASAKVRNVARRLGGTWYFTIAVYLVLFFTVDFLADLPLRYYRGYVRQHAYGLSNQTVDKWLFDSVVFAGISALVGVLFAWVPYLMMRKSPRRWWLYTTFLSVPFLFGVVLLKPIWVDPLFNDFGPMKNKALEHEILSLAERVGINGSRIYEVDKSVDTNAVNAYVTGLLGTKRIVLWDTLLARLDDREVLVVMGHEMGHYVLGHIPRSILLSTLITLASLFWVDRTGRWLIARSRDRFGFDQLSDIASVPLLLLLLQISTLAMTPIANAYSRHQEHEADRFALELTHSNREAAEAFVKLQQENLAIPRPGLFYRLWRGSHPSIGERIDFCNAYRPWANDRPLQYSRWIHP